MTEPVSVLFVCLGNICRSTMAEGVFRHMVKQPQYEGLTAEIDSCGTGAYHEGQGPDRRTLSTLDSKGITDYRPLKHRARQFRSSTDFDKFDYIFAMDESNLSDLRRLHRSRPNSKAQVMLFGTWSGHDEAEEVDDPYYGGADGFEDAYQQCSRFSKNFLAKLLQDREEDSRQSPLPEP